MANELKPGDCLSIKMLFCQYKNSLYKAKTYRIVYGLRLITMFVVTGGVIRQKFSWVTQSRVKIIGESPHEWPQISLLTAAHILFHFLHDFRVLKQICRWKLISITDPLLWYCDVPQTPIVMSFGPIVMRMFPSGSHASSHRHQADYHSLIIDNYSLRFHWLVCKKALSL